MKIVLLGAPGIGKTTIAGMIAKRFKLKLVDLGQHFRSELKRNTKFGRFIKRYIDGGVLIPIHVTVNYLKKIIKNNKNFILDDYPKTWGQAEALAKFAPPDIIFNLNAKRSTIIQRISGRRICVRCGAGYHIKNQPPKKKGICDKCGSRLIQREDDTPKIIKKRLKVYKERIKPVMKYYGGKIINIDAEKPLSDYFNEMSRIIKGYS